MACCCTKILRLCPVTTCEGSRLVIPEVYMLPAANGRVTLELDFLDGKVQVSNFQIVNIPYAWNTDGLNENYTFTGRLLDEDGVLITIPDPEDELKPYDCLQFETVPVQSIVTPEP